MNLIEIEYGSQKTAQWAFSFRVKASYGVNDNNWSDIFFIKILDCFEDFKLVLNIKEFQGWFIIDVNIKVNIEDRVSFIV